MYRNYETASMCNFELVSGEQFITLHICRKPCTMKSSYLFLKFLSVCPLDTVLCCISTFSYPSLSTEVRGKLDKSVLSFQHVGPEAQTAGCLPWGRESFWNIFSSLFLQSAMGRLPASIFSLQLPRMVSVFPSPQFLFSLKRCYWESIKDFLRLCLKCGSLHFLTLGWGSSIDCDNPSRVDSRSVKSVCYSRFA